MLEVMRIINFTELDLQFWKWTSSEECVRRVLEEEVKPNSIKEYRCGLESDKIPLAKYVPGLTGELHCFHDTQSWRPSTWFPRHSGTIHQIRRHRLPGTLVSSSPSSQEIRSTRDEDRVQVTTLNAIFSGNSCLPALEGPWAVLRQPGASSLGLHRQTNDNYENYEQVHKFKTNGLIENSSTEPWWQRTQSWFI